MEIDGDKCLSPSSPSLTLSRTNAQMWTHTWTHFLSPSELYEIHPQLYSILLTTARESFSRFILSGQRFTAERAASLALVGVGLLFRGIIRSHLIFISYWEIRDDKLF